MTWNDVIADKCLQDLPYKIETDRFGQVVMSPASNRHGFYQGVVSFYLRSLGSSGKVVSKCSVDTDDGTKVADVAWLSETFYNSHGLDTPYPLSPDLCVEIVSPSNSREEMRQKRALYFAQGAKEVWLCDHYGKLRFFSPTEELAKSLLFPDFPKTVAPQASN